MALRFYSTYKSFAGGQGLTDDNGDPILDDLGTQATSGYLDWRIEIHDSQHVGDSTEFRISDRGGELTYRGDGGELTSPILGSSFSFDMMIQDATHEDLITDLVSSKEGRFTVKVLRDIEFYWAGVINAPDVVYEDEYYPYSFTVSAVDGLALLRNYEYRQEITSSTKWETKYEGQSNIVAIIARCLKKLPHIETHFSDLEKFIITAVNWYSDGQGSITSTSDPLYEHYIDNRAFGSGQASGNGTFLSCYEVLTDICTAFYARIALVDGSFLMEQYEHRSTTIGSPANYSRYYPYGIDGPVAYTLPTSQDIGQGTALPKLNGGTYSLSPPLRDVRVTQKVDALANLIGGFITDSAAPATAIAGSVYGNGGLSYVRFTAGVEWSLTNVDLADKAYFAIFALTLKIKDKWAKREITFNGVTTWDNSSITWESSADTIKIPIEVQWPESGETWTGQGGVNLFFRCDSGFDYGDLTVSFDLEQLQYHDPAGAGTVIIDPADYELDWALKDPYCVIQNSAKGLIGNSLPVVYPKAVTYQVNGDSDNTEEKEIKTIIGDRTGAVLNQWGGLLYLDGSDYVYTSQWGNRNGTRDRIFSQLLAQRYLSSMYYPRKIFRGTIVGNTLAVGTPVEYDGEVYILTNGTYSTVRDELNGEWLRLAYTAAEFSYEDPEYDTGDYEASGPGGGSASGGGGGSIDNGGTGGGGSGGGNGIYGGSGIVSDGVTATLAGDFSFSNPTAASGDKFSVTLDDGVNSNTVKIETDDGILIQSTGDAIQIEGVTALTDIISPSTISTDQNDYAGLDGANVGRLAATTAVNITGIANGVDGRILPFHNVGSNPITLVNASASSTAANRFDIGEDYTIRADHGCLLQYDGVDSRWRILACYSLGRWAEAYATGTAPTASLTATAPATNIGAAIVPKGTGALTAAVPDGTSTGGNARGSRAVDLQTDRNNAAQVASGANSGVLYGRRSTASGSYAFAGGNTCTASGNGSVALGGTGAIGGGSTASGSSSFAFGNAAAASATNSIAFGPGSAASAQSAVAFNTTAAKYEEFATLHVSHLGLTNTVTGTAATELFLDGSSLTAAVPTATAWIVDVYCFARVLVAGNGTVAANDSFAAVYRCVIANKGGTTALIGTVDTEMAAKSDASMADVVFTITADNTGDYLKVTYTAGANSGSTTQTRATAKLKVQKF